MSVPGSIPGSAGHQPGSNESQVGLVPGAPGGVPTGYKRTEEGVIPEEWEVRPIGEVLRKGRLGGNYPNQLRPTDFPLMKMGNLSRGSMDLSKSEFIKAGVKPEEQHRLQRGDVLFNTRNTLDLVGKVAVWRDELPVAYYNSNLMRLEFDENQVCSNEYACAALNTKASVARLRELATGTTSVAAIYTRDLMQLPFVVPPLSEQRAIAEALGDVDALLGALDAAIAKQRDLKQAAMQQLLTGQTRLPGFQGEWGVNFFGDIFVFSGGVPASRDQLSTDGHCYLHYGDIHTSSKTWVDVEVERQSIPRLNIDLRSVPAKALLKDGDVVFVDASEDDAGTSKHVVVRNPSGIPFISGLHTIVAKQRECRMARDYLSYCFQTAEIRRQFTLFAVGTKVSGVSKSNIVNITMPIPPKDEQAAIAAVLSAMDAKITVLESRRAKAAALKQAMMQELLTGRKRFI